MVGLDTLKSQLRVLMARVPNSQDCGNALSLFVTRQHYKCGFRYSKGYAWRSKNLSQEALAELYQFGMHQCSAQTKARQAPRGDVQGGNITSNVNLNQGVWDLTGGAGAGAGSGGAAWMPGSVPGTTPGFGTGQQGSQPSGDGGSAADDSGLPPWPEEGDAVVPNEDGSLPPADWDQPLPPAAVKKSPWPWVIGLGVLGFGAWMLWGRKKKR